MIALAASLGLHIITYQHLIKVFIHVKHYILVITVMGNEVLERRSNPTYERQVSLVTKLKLGSTNTDKTHPSSVSFMISQISMLAAQSSDGKFPSVAFSKRMTNQ